MQHHIEAPDCVLRRLDECSTDDYTQQHEADKAFVRFVICASRTADYLDVYHMEL